MVTSTADPFPPTDWQAADLKQFRRVWEDLRPDSADERTERKFRDRRLTAKQAGEVFERWILEAFRLSGMSGHYAFQVPLRESGSIREQIDGMVLDGWQGFLIESKFWPNKVDFGPIALLHTLVERRPVGTLGLVFSAFGYTKPALDSAELLHPLRVLLVERADLEWALASRAFRGRMAEMVRRKWALAVKYGHPHMPVSSVIELFN
jgi:hypothetical protein